MECVPTGVLSLGIDNLYYGVHIFVEYMYFTCFSIQFSTNAYGVAL